LWLKVVYFSLYTFFLIASTTLIRGNEPLRATILKMKKKGLTQKDIANRLGLSESKISRMVKKDEEA